MSIKQPISIQSKSKQIALKKDFMGQSPYFNQRISFDTKGQHHHPQKETLI